MSCRLPDAADILDGSASRRLRCRRATPCSRMGALAPRDVAALISRNACHEQRALKSISYGLPIMPSRVPTRVSASDISTAYDAREVPAFKYMARSGRASIRPFRRRFRKRASDDELLRICFRCRQKVPPVSARDISLREAEERRHR